MADKMRILVVEDDREFARLMSASLQEIGCDVQIAFNGGDGLELATENKFDLITLDVNLPDISGFEICRELKQRHISYRTPIVFVAGRATDEDRKRAFELDAVEFFEKPVRLREFIARISAVTGHQFTVPNIDLPERGTADAG
jgi:DNA-binding response OmpR family regulator